MDQRLQWYRACQSRSCPTCVGGAGSYARLSAWSALWAPPRIFFLGFSISFPTPNITVLPIGARMWPCMNRAALLCPLVLAQGPTVLFCCIGHRSLHSLSYIKRWRNFWVWAKVLEFHSLNWSARWYWLGGGGVKALYNLLFWSSTITNRKQHSIGWREKQPMCINVWHDISL